MVLCTDFYRKIQNPIETNVEGDSKIYSSAKNEQIRLVQKP